MHVLTMVVPHGILEKVDFTWASQHLKSYSVSCGVFLVLVFASPSSLQWYHKVYFRVKLT